MTYALSTGFYTATDPRTPRTRDASILIFRIDVLGLLSIIPVFIIHDVRLDRNNYCVTMTRYYSMGMCTQQKI